MYIQALFIVNSTPSFDMLVFVNGLPLLVESSSCLLKAEV